MPQRKSAGHNGVSHPSGKALGTMAFGRKVSLNCARSPRRYSPLEKTQIILVIYSLICIFELRSKILSLTASTSNATRPKMRAFWLSLLFRFGNAKKNKFSFGIPLTYCINFSRSAEKLLFLHSLNRNFRIFAGGKLKQTNKTENYAKQTKKQIKNGNSIF